MDGAVEMMALPAFKVTVVALEVDQERVVLWPKLMLAGRAAKELMTGLPG